MTRALFAHTCINRTQEIFILLYNNAFVKINIFVVSFGVKGFANVERETLNPER